MRATKRPSFINLLIASFLILGQTLNAGVITGRVTDVGTGSYLPGANVILEGTAFGAASDRSGEYRIANVPPGSYTLNVTYIGYEDFSVEITVPDEEVTQDFQLQATYVELGEVVVQGLRQGQAKALSQQRSSDRIMNVISSDQMQRFPDINVAESLQRMPGLAIIRDQGEGRYVIVRGMEPRLNSMMINGQRIPSPESAIRNPSLDVIPSNQLASVEVTKALTPDMDGDAIGGAVNLVTKNAFDYDQRVLNFSLGGGYKNLRGSMPYQAAFTFADKFMDDKLGVLVSSSYSSTGQTNGTDNIELEWADSYEYVTDVKDWEASAEVDDGEWEIDDGDTTWIYEVEEKDGTVLENMQIRHYLVIRNRLGASGSLNYKLNDQNSFYLEGIYNYFNDYENRNRVYFRFDKSVDEEEQFSGYESPTSVKRARVERQLKDRFEAQTIYSYTAGGKHKFPRLELDYWINSSYAEEDENHSRYFDFEEKKYDLDYDMTDRDNPKVTSSDPDYNVLTGFEFDVFENNGPKWQTDKDLTIALNVKLPYNLGPAVGTLKFGGKYLSKATEKDYTSALHYEWDGEGDLVMSDYAKELVDTTFMGGNYEYYHTVDTIKFLDFWAANKASFDENPDLEYKYYDSFTATEQITAAYGMTTLRFGGLMVLAGARLEMTTTAYNSHEGDIDDEDSFVPTSGGKDYTDILPMVHLRYGLNDRTILRAAYTKSLARPNYEQLTPYRFTDDDELSIGNPDLDNTVSSNLDVMAEYYLGTLGILSGGYFRKTLTDYIYNKVTEDPEGEPDISEMTQPMNGDEANLSGFEVNWQQQLTFLPGPLSGLGVYVNYTNTQSVARYFDRDSTSLPGQAEHVANFALSYENYGFTGQISVNYRGELIDEVGSDADDDVIYDARAQVDFSATYQLTPTFVIFCDALNLTNARDRYYVGSPDLPVQRELYGLTINVGLKLNF